MKVTLDHAGIAAILKSAPVARAVRGVADGVAGNVRGMVDADVVVDSYTTDRAASSVTIRHYQARTWQARDGVFTRAAGARGLTVRSR